jgi:hypothetical protein
MFRKLHSNRNPQDTILSELKREFAGHIAKSSVKIIRMLQRKPFFAFSGMVVLLILSAAISFTIARNKTEAITKRTRVNAVSDGFRQMLSISRSIRQTLSLRHEIDSLSAKAALTKTDSQTLVKDLDKLQQLNKPFKK